MHCVKFGEIQEFPVKFVTDKVLHITTGYTLTWEWKIEEYDVDFSFEFLDEHGRVLPVPFVLL